MFVVVFVVSETSVSRNSQHEAHATRLVTFLVKIFKVPGIWVIKTKHFRPEDRQLQPLLFRGCRKRLDAETVKRIVIFLESARLFFNHTIIKRWNS